MSHPLPVSFATSRAEVLNRMYRPFALIASAEAAHPALDDETSAATICEPSLLRSTRCVVCAARSRTNASKSELVSPGTRFVAAESNKTYRPSALIDRGYDRPSAGEPSAPTDINSWPGSANTIVVVVVDDVDVE